MENSTLQSSDSFASQLANQLASAHIRFTTAASVALLIAWATLFGGGNAPLVRRLMDFPASDKVGHIVLYASLTATVVWALGDKRFERLGSLPAWPALIFGIGLLDELRQYGLADRNFELADLAANTLGIWAGWSIAAWFLSKRDIPHAHGGQT